MLLDTHKVIFIKSEALLLCAVMWERAKALAATIQFITFWYSFCDYKIRFLHCTFQTHFDIGTRHSQKVVLKMILLLSLQSFICHIANIGVWKCIFTGLIMKIKIFHSYHARVVRVALVSHSCRSCSTRVTHVSFVSHS